MNNIPRNENPLKPGKEMPHPQEIPKPGSKEAIEQGCNCVRFPDNDWEGWYKVGCPLHDPERREE